MLPLYSEYTSNKIYPDEFGMYRYFSFKFNNNKSFRICNLS